MEELEEKAISTFETKPIIWKRNVEDIFFIWPGNYHSIEEFYNHLNLQDENIKFTFELELEVEDCVPFLDVELSRLTGEISTKVYRKPTNSYLYLQKNSAHPTCVKNGIANTFVHRAESLCSDINSYNTEVDLDEKVLMNNKYPKQLLRNINRKSEKKTNVVQQDHSVRLILS
jgi:hypothetical protein